MTQFLSSFEKNVFEAWIARCSMVEFALRDNFGFKGRTP